MHISNINTNVLRNHGGHKAMEHKEREKETVNQEFDMQQNYSSKINRSKDISK
jgi:hypothetical protein